MPGARLQVFAAMERAKGSLKFLDWGVANATLEEVGASDAARCCLPTSMQCLWMYARSTARFE